MVFPRVRVRCLAALPLAGRGPRALPAAGTPRRPRALDLTARRHRSWPPSPAPANAPPRRCSSTKWPRRTLARWTIADRAPAPARRHPCRPPRRPRECAGSPGRLPAARTRARRLSPRRLDGRRRHRRRRRAWRAVRSRPPAARARHARGRRHPGRHPRAHRDARRGRARAPARVPPEDQLLRRLGRAAVAPVHARPRRVRHQRHRADSAASPTTRPTARISRARRWR